MSYQFNLQENTSRVSKFIEIFELQFGIKLKVLNVRRDFYKYSRKGVECTSRNKSGEMMNKLNRVFKSRWGF